ncbi:PLP-dependent transferase [Clavulina sp. PMI_390]|nr:PLP-dependent transferase [Clavulina sp. PMI_390]
MAVIRQSYSTHDDQHRHISAHDQRRTSDLSHHFSELAKGRAPSPLKSILRMTPKVPGIISMAGGAPHPDYFPFDSLSAEALVQDAYSVNSTASPSHSQPQSSGIITWLWDSFFTSSAVPTKTMTIPKYDVDRSNIQLSEYLQYDIAVGKAELIEFIRNFTRSVFKPARADAVNMLHGGNTVAFAHCIETFCNSGEFLLVEEWAYTSALHAVRPYGVKPLGVPLDSQGMRSDALEDILSNWDAKARVMYTVPVGQNPTGTTMGIDRRREIYDICVKYDIVIIEDDPYYFLQVGEYIDRKLRVTTQAPGDDKVFLDGLVPSYIRLDYQGRVVRLDTFSKTIAPGCRLGWYTTSPLFLERLERVSEISTQAPSGFSQALVGQLLTKQWKYDGFVRWLKGLRAQYTIRRDQMVDTLHDFFDLEEEHESDRRVFIARSKRYGSKNEDKKGKVLLSFVSPNAGMFIWFKVHLYNHPLYASTPPPTTPADSLEYKLWTDLAFGGILMAPGWVFGTDADAMLESETVVSRDMLTGIAEAAHGPHPGGKHYTTLSENGRFGHLRISYSDTTPEKIEKGLTRFVNILDKHFYGV